VSRGASVGKNKRSGGHTRKKRHSGASTNGVDYHTATKEGCSSGKWGWTERAGAKTLVRILRKEGGGKIREYACLECGRWHVGHMPKDVLKGRLGARDIYRPDEP
jgi:hypothetical protein